MVCEVIGGCGVDVVVEIVGVFMFEQLMEVVVMYGFVGIVGFMGGCEVLLFLVQVIFKWVWLQGILVVLLEEYECMVSVLEVIWLILVIDVVYGFGELCVVFEYFVVGWYFGKIGIDFMR